MNSLSQELDAVAKLGMLSKELPHEMKNNLASKITLRPYQSAALERFLFFMEDHPDRPPSPHLLFHMATGSGKTVIMAAIILYLYQKGYRNFLFFVNSIQIIEKTKENFLNPLSNKFLFSNQIRIDDKLVKVQAVSNFEEADSNAINILFTTIQGLQSVVLSPRENAVSFEDFVDREVVLISDEAHHLNAETKTQLTRTERIEKQSWEQTVTRIFQASIGSLLLEFTATVDMEHEAICEKYSNKIIYDYPLKQFRQDGYSKDIKLRQADLLPVDRMLQSVVLSQYRRKIAEARGVHCKPVILMKSRTIQESNDNEIKFITLIENISGKDLRDLQATSAEDKTLAHIFTYIFEERGMDADTFSQELLVDFSPEKIVNVNRLQDLHDKQIKLNSLEDCDNEIRVIFAVDKLNEGWDVLNLFDIVRLYDTRDCKANKIGKTTMQEAQLIGRGARYFPFKDPDQPDAVQEKRKYDKKIEDPLRALEELHYHCSHNPKYIYDIQNALRETGILDETARTVTVRVKRKFKQTELFKKGHLWVNQRLKNSCEGMQSLENYLPELDFTFPRLMTGRVSETLAFSSTTSGHGKSDKEFISKTFNLKDLNPSIIRFALDTNAFFYFEKLQKYFPSLRGMNQFMTSKKYLGGVRVKVSGLAQDVESLNAHQKLEMVQFALHQIEGGIKQGSVEYVGDKNFKPQELKSLIVDKTLKIGLQGETGRSWEDSEIRDLSLIDLGKKDWHVYDNNYGTDQEKHFIRFLCEKEQQIKKLYDEFFLIRNERLFTLYSFQDGEPFEPDFLLFLKKTDAEKSVVMQLFIEPKGQHLKLHDQWKESFLKEINSQAKINIVFQGRDYSVYGLPFFNNEGEMKQDFESAIQEFISNRINT